MSVFAPLEPYMGYVKGPLGKVGIDLDKLKEDLDKYAEMLGPKYNEICTKNKLPPGVLLGIIIFVSSLILIVTQGYNMLCALVTCVNPMLNSLKAIEDSSPAAERAQQQWLTFWTVLAVYQTFEMFAGFILGMIPWYRTIRLAAFVFLQWDNQALTIYDRVFKPLLAKYRADIEEFIQHVSDQAKELGNEAMNAAKD